MTTEKKDPQQTPPDDDEGGVTVTRSQAVARRTESFGGKTTDLAVETASTAIAAQARAEVEARFTMALHRPRDIDDVRVALLKDCERPAFAEKARYRKPIGGGKHAEGPSIRFIETALQRMGNISTEAIPIYDDDHRRVLRVLVTDLETNLTHARMITLDKTVERSQASGRKVLDQRKNSNNQAVFIVLATEDEINTKEAAMVSKALRTLGERCVPRDIVDECMASILDIRRKGTSADPAAARKKLLDAFAEIGVRPRELKKYVGGQDLDSLSPAQIDELRDLWQTIRDGETTWKDVLDTREEEQNAASTQAAAATDQRTAEVTAAAAAGNAAATPAAEPAATTPAAEPATPTAETPAATTTAEKPKDEKKGGGLFPAPGGKK